MRTLQEMRRTEGRRNEVVPIVLLNLTISTITVNKATGTCTGGLFVNFKIEPVESVAGIKLDTIQRLWNDEDF